jgi:hypothetical protein
MHTGVKECIQVAVPECICIHAPSCMKGSLSPMCMCSYMFRCVCVSVGVHMHTGVHAHALRCIRLHCSPGCWVKLFLLLW